MLFSLTYLINLVQDKRIGSITPTSRFGVKRILDKIDFFSADTIVEYGPGTGVICKALLKQMKPDAKLIAIETNKKFVRILRKQIKDPRFFIFHDSAENVTGCLRKAGASSADYIISGIPFTMLDNETANHIVYETEKMLNIGGKFLVYQFLLYLENESSKGIHRFLPSHFQVINKQPEMLNIPPLRVYEAIKTRAINYQAKISAAL
ncbi:MAG: methyltransferase domain-containing protein [Proteobacteria bacterium]|nr:methyltransferase domain-containing protein [Pseudomonadota bacterium]